MTHIEKQSILAGKLYRNTKEDGTKEYFYIIDGKFDEQHNGYKVLVIEPDDPDVEYRAEYNTLWIDKGTKPIKVSSENIKYVDVTKLDNVEFVSYYYDNVLDYSYIIKETDAIKSIMNNLDHVRSHPKPQCVYEVTLKDNSVVTFIVIIHHLGGICEYIHGYKYFEEKPYEEYPDCPIGIVENDNITSYNIVAMKLLGLMRCEDFKQLCDIDDANIYKTEVLTLNCSLIPVEEFNRYL